MQGSLAALLACLVLVNADIYLHNPRGSNNRLNERSANRRNGNRVFDSQNNNRGGFNVGDVLPNSDGNADNEQYKMKYFQSDPGNAGKSYLTFQWTNQHGCGGSEDSDPQKSNCNLVLQYMCQDEGVSKYINPGAPTICAGVKLFDVTTTPSADVLRNGLNTNKQQYVAPRSLRETKNQFAARKRVGTRFDRALHEGFEAYDKCYVRERNYGLFTADQNLRRSRLRYSGAIFTRQNARGTARGLECPEERDYYPYWHPTEWKDIAVLAENQTMCNHYETKSFNVQPYGECVEYWDTAKTQRKHYSRWNNAAQCTAKGGLWQNFYNYLEKAPKFTNEGACDTATEGGHKYRWAVPYDSKDGTTRECLVLMAAPDCRQAPWSRVNHLGNGRDGVANNYTWSLPHFPSGKTKRCVFRMRYNISTDDYDPYNTNSSHNNNPRRGVISPVTNNPTIGLQVPLRLALNTAQTGRTFQDRTHVFLLAPRTANMAGKTIYNLNVRGKRGNIVQTFPAVEYDFYPNNLQISPNDLVHIQWTGSNTHNNGNPAGDGQAGDDGEGQRGTDRHNLVQLNNLNQNFPATWEQSDLFKGARVYWMHHGETGIGEMDLALSMASSGYYECVDSTKQCPAKLHNYAVNRKGKMQNQLNNAPPSYPGAVLAFKRGTYYYMCTRNNNFTNRSQKAKLVVQ